MLPGSKKQEARSKKRRQRRDFDSFYDAIINFYLPSILFVLAEDEAHAQFGHEPLLWVNSKARVKRRKA